MRRCVFFRVVPAIRVVVYVRQRATGPELMGQVNVQVFASGLRWTGAGTLHRQRGFQHPGSRRASTHRAARRGDLGRSPSFIPPPIFATLAIFRSAHARSSRTARNRQTLRSSASIRSLSQLGSAKGRDGISPETVPFGSKSLFAPSVSSSIGFKRRATARERGSVGKGISVAENLERR